MVAGRYILTPTCTDLLRPLMVTSNYILNAWNQIKRGEQIVHGYRVITVQFRSWMNLAAYVFTLFNAESPLSHNITAILDMFYG